MDGAEKGGRRAVEEGRKGTQGTRESEKESGKARQAKQRTQYFGRGWYAFLIEYCHGHVIVLKMRLQQMFPEWCRPVTAAAAPPNLQRIPPPENQRRQSQQPSRQNQKQHSKSQYLPTADPVVLIKVMANL